ncbi:hypothetical protein GCM10010440_50470 [Kitasatospora cinereorecta]
MRTAPFPAADVGGPGGAGPIDVSFFSRPSSTVNTPRSNKRIPAPSQSHTGGGMTPVAVNPSSLPAPSGYSHGTLSGNTLYLGGQTALDADMRIVPGGIVEQFRQAFGNVLTTLREVGGRPEDLVSITLYLTDIPDYQAHGREIGKVWRELAGPVYPAMAGIGCTALWQPEAMIEILGVAVVPDERLVRPAVPGQAGA